MAELLSVNVGLPHNISWQGRAVHTSVSKQPAPGAGGRARLNTEGDARRDLAGQVVNTERPWSTRSHPTDVPLLLLNAYLAAALGLASPSSFLGANPSLRLAYASEAPRSRVA
jgi:hypothetical protein